jgi:hypothetical protein
MSNTDSATPAQATEVSAVSTLLTRFKSLRDELSSLEKSVRDVLKEAERTAKSAKKSKKARRDPSAPKGEMPAQTKQHMDQTKVILKKMVAEGWSAHKTKKGVDCPKSVKNAEGRFVFEGSITESHPKGREPTYKDALIYKGFIEPSAHKEKSATATEAKTAPVAKAVEAKPAVKAEAKTAPAPTATTAPAEPKKVAKKAPVAAK